MPHDGRAIANFVLDHADGAGWPITNLKLNKLVYFCHVWSLIELNRPLIKHQFEAWEHGPVLQYLYQEFKDCGAQPIRDRATRIDLSSGQRVPATYELNEPTRQLLERVLNFYGRLSAAALVEMTHAKDGPWHKVWHHPSSVEPGMKIDNREITRFYARALAPFPLQ
jgi:uncharacterized phage-associated protein